MRILTPPLSETIPVTVMPGSGRTRCCSSVIGRQPGNSPSSKSRPSLLQVIPRPRTWLHAGTTSGNGEIPGTSPEVNALRSRIRREIADLIRSLWAQYEPEAASSPHADAISVGVFGILFESMVHLAECNRLHEAPAHVAPLVTAIDRVLGPSAPR